MLLQDTPPQTPPQTPATPPAAEGVTDAVSKQVDNLAQITDQALHWMTTKGPSVLAALVLLVAAIFVAGWVRRFMLAAMKRAKLDLTLAKFFANLARWAILVFAFVTSLGTLGIDTTSMAALVAAAGLAIGLALQGNLGNLASGVLILVFRPFKIGDAVIVAGQAGIVDGIDLFTTNLDTADMRRIIVPNGAVFGGIIENQSRHPVRRIDLNVALNPGVELDKARAVLKGAVDRVVAAGQGALGSPEPAVSLGDIAPYLWTINLWAQTSAYPVVRQALLREVKLAVDGAKMGPPGPGMEVKITAMPEGMVARGEGERRQVVSS